MRCNNSRYKRRVSILYYNIFNFFLISFRALKWKACIDEDNKFLDGSPLPCVLVENKTDLLDPTEANNVISLKGFANANNFLASFRTSAKTGLNINESMTYLVENILNKMKTLSSQDFTPDRTSCTLDPTKHQEKDNIRSQQKGGCC